MKVSDWIKKVNETCAWNGNYKILIDFIRDNDVKKMVEIGVAYGGHAEAILANTFIEEYVAIDPYVADYDSREDGYIKDILKLFPSSSPQEGMDKLYNAVKKRLSIFNDRVKLIRGNSDELSKFNDSYFDLIFIDGHHEFNSVLKDMNNSWNKVKVGGAMAGDDFNWAAGDDVKRAVTDYTRDNYHKLNFLQNTHWIIYKYN